MPLNIAGRYNVTNIQPPVRLYVHTAGIREAFDKEPIKAYKHLETIMQRHAPHFEDTLFAIALAWGDGSTRVLDFFEYRKPAPKKEDNPEIRISIFRGDQYFAEQSTICGNGARILGAEEKAREDSLNIDAHIHFPPREGILRSIKEFIVPL